MATGLLQYMYGFEIPMGTTTELVNRSGFGTTWTLDTTIFDPLGGSAGLKADQVGTGSYLWNPTTHFINTSYVDAMGMWFYLDSAPDAARFHVLAQVRGAAGSTNQANHIVVRNDMKLEVYASTSYSIIGTATGTATSSAISATTGYWMWITSVATADGGNLKVYIDHTLVLDYTWSGTTGGIEGIMPWGPQGGGPGAPNNASTIDNVVGVAYATVYANHPAEVPDAGGSRLWRAAIKASTVTGAGTNADFTAQGAASNYLCVDEAAANDETDYVWSDAGAASVLDTYNMSAPSTPTGYRPYAVAPWIRHRNADGGKWVAKATLGYFQGVQSVQGGGGFNDPGAAYVGGHGDFGNSGTAPYFMRKIPSGNNDVVGSYLSDADIADMELGFAAGNAVEAAEWRVTMIQAEVLYLSIEDVVYLAVRRTRPRQVNETWGS